MDMSNPTIFVIADYGIGDPAFTEVILQLRSRIPGAFVYPHSTPPFSTVNTGFWIYQIALAANDGNTFIYSNTAPRSHDKEAQKNNSGEKLMYAKLVNGFQLMAVHAGYTFSFIKPYIMDFSQVQVEDNGSQFRSRDKFPQVISQMVEGDPSFLSEIVDISSIPNYPHNVIASIDGYGNIKTTIRLSQTQLNSGDEIALAINNKTYRAIFTDGMFNIPHGHRSLTFAPGSSGYDDPFMEISVRGDNAAALFGNPPVEEKILIRMHPNISE